MEVRAVAVLVVIALQPQHRLHLELHTPLRLVRVVMAQQVQERKGLLEATQYLALIHLLAVVVEAHQLIQVL
jgi:hypothetical protein